MEVVMKNSKLVVLATIAALLCSSNSTFAGTNMGDIVTIDQFKATSSFKIEKMVNQLIQRYPNLLEKVSIGKSADQKPLYIVVLSDEKNLIKPKTSLLLESGTHSRETVNPYITLSMLELYCKDFTNEAVIPTYSMRNILQDAAIHTSILTNPDGYDLVTQGPKSIVTKKVSELLSKISNKDYAKYKASATGVDLNRNFASQFYDLAKMVWSNPWGSSKKTIQMAYQPSSEFFGGKVEASEPETQALSKYIDTTSLDGLLSLHSQGNIIYYDRLHLGNEYNARALKYGNLMGKITGYKVMKPNYALTAYGYLGDYFANTTFNPAITLETTVSALPTAISRYASTFNIVKYAPLEMLKALKVDQVKTIPVYVQDNLYKKFANEAYAKAVAQKVKGTLEPPKPVEAVIEVEIEDTVTGPKDNTSPVIDLTVPPVPSVPVDPAVPVDPTVPVLPVDSTGSPDLRMSTLNNK
jgi:g-D-glutamyl-meso-diaminopimelate peptidase